MLRFLNDVERNLSFISACMLLIKDPRGEMYHVEDETLSIDWQGWKVEIVSLQENAYRSNRPLFYGMELLNKFHND